MTTANTAEKATPEMPVKTLRERLLGIASKVGTVNATGKNQYGSTTLSIGDVEAAVRPLLADAGVLTRWSALSLSYLPEAKMWLRRLIVTVENADDKDDNFTDEWEDIGSNPMAAASFARKGYYKSLFHITEEDDEGTPNTPANGNVSQHSSYQDKVAQAPALQSLGECVQCAAEGIQSKKGYASKYFRNPAGQVSCNGYRDGEYLNHKQAPVEEEIPY